MLRELALAAVLTITAHTASASTFGQPPIVPVPDFNGDGIPDDTMVWSQFTNGDDTITFGLSATQRFFNPVVTNDGANTNTTYAAGPGQNNGGPGSTSSLTGALWNFNWVIDISGQGTSTIADYGFELKYDVSPDGLDQGTITGLGLVGISSAGSVVDGTARRSESSQNLFFNYLTDVSIPGYWTVPGGDFDANALGSYAFSLSANNGSTVESVSMNVNVVPVPAALPLLASAFGIAALVKRRSRRA